jgi:hypothetical protein
VQLQASEVADVVEGAASGRENDCDSLNSDHGLALSQLAGRQQKKNLRLDLNRAAPLGIERCSNAQLEPAAWGLLVAKLGGRKICYAGDQSIREVSA